MTTDTDPTETMPTPQPASLLPLQPLTFPLSGASLIEASAGTGKTYTISSFYLRLVIGHQCTPLAVEQILLVTFTNAATNELKERLHARLHRAFLDFEQDASDDEFVAQLIQSCTDKRLAKQRLLVAKQSMDNAAIFTIHGFCQRMLSQHAFESGSVYEQTLILDDSDWIQLACVDFWRQHVVNLPLNELGLLLSFCPSPDTLQSLLQPLLRRHVRLPVVNKADYQQHLQDYLAAVEHIKQWWRERHVAARLAEAKLKARAKVSKPDNLDAMTRFAASAELILQINTGSKKEGWALFSADNINKARKKESVSLDDLDFTLFDQLAALQDTLMLSLQRYYVGFGRDRVKQRLYQHKQRFNLLSPDDLLQDLQRALVAHAPDIPNTSSDASLLNPLVRVIGRQFPVAMVDEFQDTDPVQFDIFRRIYLQPNTLQSSALQSNTEASALIMIGDPKQAIYGFRGGDIFTYLQAKHLIAPERQFTLNTNYRSQRSLVAAFNRLFIAPSKSSQNPPQDRPQAAFEFGEQIPYISVTASKESVQLLAQSALPSGPQADIQSDPNTNTHRALNINFLSASENGLWSWDLAAQHLARYCSGQIAALLQPGAFTLGSEANAKAVQAGDICVLVKDRNEALIMKSALAQLSVDSVFLIRRSVFVGDVAWQLLLLLRALHMPQDESTVRAALLSELFDFDALGFDALIQDDIRWHNVLNVFMEGQGLWHKQGVIRGMDHVLAHFDVMAHLKQHFDDGLRRITDLRHISELLQVQASVLQGEALLLNWYEQRLAEPDHSHEAQQLRLETDQNLVQITTIHASKGLQYPLVFVPFAARFRTLYNEPYFAPLDPADSRTSDGEQRGELVWDVSVNEAGQVLQRTQRMGEDARLLYVALTRAIYHCWIGLWNTAAGRSKKNSGFASTAIGQVLLHQSDTLNHLTDLSQITDANILAAFATFDQQDDIQINRLTEDDCQMNTTSDAIAEEAKQPDTGTPHYRAAELTRNIQPHWVLTSYSGISAQHQHYDEVLWEKDTKAGDENNSVNLSDIAEQNDSIAHRFEFERGVNAGSFLHAIYELSDWQSAPIDFAPSELGAMAQAGSMAQTIEHLPETSIERVMLEQANRYQLDLRSPPQTAQWIRETLHTPLLAPTGFSTSLSLAALEPTQKLAEMEFYLPLAQVHEAAFNQLLEAHQFPAQYPYRFDKGHPSKGVLNGMLKGYIDLTFEFEGRFYVADYKSNHLGDHFAHYQQPALIQAMQEHDYYLQALLYTLALHRFLSVSLPGYTYQQHIGGAWYLFIRGMHPEQPDSGETPDKSTEERTEKSTGVLHILPSEALIMQLDNLFGQPQDPVQDLETAGEPE